MKYRKKPVVIEAIKWTGNNIEEVVNFAKDHLSIQYLDYPPSVHIYTLEGTMKANIGDYIIKGVQEEFYPCKSDIFELTYEIVEHKGE